MLCLRALGCLSTVKTFDQELKLDLVARQYVPKQRRRVYQGVLDLSKRNGDRSVELAVRSALGLRFSLLHVASVFRYWTANAAFRYLPRVVRERFRDKLMRVIR